LQPVAPDMTAKAVSLEQRLLPFPVSGVGAQATSELDLRRRIDGGALAFLEFEELALGESERAGDEDSRELLDRSVVFLDRVVEEAARGGDLVLDVGE